MRLGISITSGYPGAAPAAVVGNVIARARAAAGAGLDLLCLGDHHATGPDRPYAQNVPMIGRLSAEWPADRPIGLLLLLPLWNPVLAAEQVGTLAAMSDVPFVVQTGIGGGAEAFAAMGADLARRGARTDESIRVIKGLLAGERVSSEMLGVTGAAVAPCPPHGVEWWIGAGAGDRPLDRAAREGDAWYASPGLGAEDVARYRDRCEVHGTTPRVVLRVDVLVADDDDEAVRRGRQILADGYRGMSEDVVAFGGVDRVAERLAALAAVGADDLVVRTMAVDQASAVRSIELLGEVRRRLSAT